jgi:hypothetical protein
MKTTGKYYVYPEDKEKVAVVVSELNALFDGLFSEKNYHAVTKKIDILDEALIILKNFCKDKACHLLVDWFSDDIGQFGFDFDNANQKDNLSISVSFGGADILMTDFLLSCNMKNLIEREIV